MAIITIIIEKTACKSGLLELFYMCIKIKKIKLTVENKYDSMKDALLWCYMPSY